jgi:hypothetical protein
MLEANRIPRSVRGYRVGIPPGIEDLAAMGEFVDGELANSITTLTTHQHTNTPTHQFTNSPIHHLQWGGDRVADDGAEGSI